MDPQKIVEAVRTLSNASFECGQVQAGDAKFGALAAKARNAERAVYELTGVGLEHWPAELRTSTG